MRVGPTLEQLRKEYSDSVRVVYKMHPLPNHPFAQIAAQAALAAQQQDKFMEMHELLMSSSRSFNSLAAAKHKELGLPTGQERSSQVQEAVFTALASQIGLDTGRFQTDLKDPSLQQRIRSEVKEVTAIGATGTPASFVNGRYLRGAQPYTAFKSLVDKALGS